MDDAYSKFKKILLGVLIVCVVLLIGGCVFLNYTPTGKKIITEYGYQLDKSSENNYDNRKEVEDTCRSMIASYNSDKMIYEQYKNSVITEEVSWANNAKIRCNTTASTYNNYIIKNTYVFKGNVPNDIYMTLPYLN